LEFYEAAARELRQSAISRRWIFCSKPAAHFRRCSEPAIGLRVINFSACQAGVQRERSLTELK
jgi:hypothetical protein